MILLPQKCNHLPDQQATGNLGSWIPSIIFGNTQHELQQILFEFVFRIQLSIHETLTSTLDFAGLPLALLLCLAMYFEKWCLLEG